MVGCTLTYLVLAFIALPTHAIQLNGSADRLDEQLVDPTSLCQENSPRRAIVQIRCWHRFQSPTRNSGSIFQHATS